MGKIMEAIFCVFYMVTVVILGSKIVMAGRNKKQILLFGIMSLILVFGDAFHLVIKSETSSPLELLTHKRRTRSVYHYRPGSLFSSSL